MSARHLLRILIVASLAGTLASLPAVAPGQESGADLSVSKTDSPDPVPVGADLTYTITVRNDGPAAAPGVHVADALALTLDFVSATASQGSCSEVALVVTCDLGIIPDGSVATVVLVVRPEAAGSLMNAASAAPTPADFDPDPTDNVAVESTTVDGGSGSGADLAISKSDAPDPVAPGSTLNYTVTVQNVGVEDAAGVTAIDLLPAQAEVLSITSSQGTCGTPIPLIATCSLGDLAAGGSATIQIAVRPDAEGTIVNTATVGSTSFDPNPLNNASGTSTNVSETADEPGASGGTGGEGAGGALAACTIIGTPLNDVLAGTEGNDVICGLGGNDRIRAKGGNDLVLAGKGNDRSGGAKGRDILKGQGGKDRLNGGAKKDKVFGGPKPDRLRGGGGRDLLNGGGGLDRCWG
ncbi:MAG: hypothetical protein ACRDKA_00975, partial [Actinomycetota bacterium]